MTHSVSDKFESYPPYFRHNHGESALDESDPFHDHDSGLDTKSDSDSDSLPVIDFSDMNPKKLSEACREWGMFRLVNHGVPEKLLSQLHQHANKLFSLSFESKQALFTSPILHFWGTPALTESGNAQQIGHVNWLEGLNIPLSKTSNFVHEHPLLESFRSLIQEYGNHKTRLAKTIFSTMAEDLKLPQKKFESYLSPSTGFLRVYRYLPCPMADQMWGINVHTDSSVLSILHQDQVGGLQVYRNNKWLDVKPIFNTLIVNIGDMMQAMSDDGYVSVKHRVRVHRQKERISIGYFLFPAEGAVIESSKYKPFTYADFQAQRELDVKTVGIKIGLSNFRIK